MRATVGEVFAREVTLTPESVAAFSRAAGDSNPIHFDPVAAAATRFGRLIASGTHTSSLLLGLTAAHLSTRGAVIGLEFSITFRRAVFADETVRVEWQVVGVKPNARLGGDIVDMRGRLTGADGLARVEATGRVLVTGQL